MPEEVTSTKNRGGELGDSVLTSFCDPGPRLWEGFQRDARRKFAGDTFEAAHSVRAQGDENGRKVENESLPGTVKRGQKHQ